MPRIVIAIAMLAAGATGCTTERLCGTTEARYLSPTSPSDTAEPGPDADGLMSTVTGDMSIGVDSGGTTTVFPPLQRWRMNVSTATPPDGYDVRISGEIRCESTFAGSEGDTFASWIFDAGFLLLGPIDEPTSITPASTTARPGMTMAAREARQPTGWLAFSSGVGEMTVSRFDPQGVFAASGWAAADPELGQPGEIRIDLDFEFTPPSP